MKCTNVDIRMIKIGNKIIGPGQPVFIIAEAGVNHFGQLDRAKRLADIAAVAGADAFKIQVYDTERMISEASPEWKARMKPKELAWTQIEELAAYCKKLGILFMASAHDLESLDRLISLGVTSLKIGSGELGNVFYLERAARIGLPVILSTGMYTIEDVEETVSIFLHAGNKNLILLHCVSLYPAYPEEINLRAMDILRERFGFPVGYSDHTEGYDIVLAAVARGAMVIEKHIALEKVYPGTWDPIVSCTKENFKEMVSSIRRIEVALGNKEKRPVEREWESRKWATKSIVSKIDIPAGILITRDMLDFKRPGTGISPKDISQIVNRKSKIAIKKDMIIQKEWLE